MQSNLAEIYIFFEQANYSGEVGAQLHCGNICYASLRDFRC